VHLELTLNSRCRQFGHDRVDELTERDGVATEVGHGLVDHGLVVGGLADRVVHEERDV
jgi:hypothetical protein